MRQTTGAGPTPAEGRFRCWSASAALWGLSTAILLVYTFWFLGALHHSNAWFQAMDAWGPITAGRYVWSGALGYVYQGTSSYALPLSFILSAPIAGLIDVLHLVDGAPYPVARPSGWIVVAPYTLLYGFPLLVAVRRLSWDLGVRSRIWAVQTACVPLVLIPCYFWGHFEDLLALTFVVFAIRWMLVDRWVKAAFLLSVAIASKQWAAMLVPLLVILAPAGQRIRTACAACLLPSLLTLFVLGVDWTDASRSLFSPLNMGTNAPGHLSFYATWLGSRTSQVSRTLGVLVTVPIAWRLRRVRGAAAVVAAVGMILVVRPFAEAVTYSYYFSPALLMAGFVSLSVKGKFSIRDWIVPVAAVAWANPRGDYATGSWWWAGELILVSIVGVQVAANTEVLFRVLRRLPGPVKALSMKPILQKMNSGQAMGETSWNR